MSHPLLLSDTGEFGAPPVLIDRSIKIRRITTQAYATRSVTVAGNRRKWTWAAWVRPAINGQTYQFLWVAAPDGYNYTGIMLANDALRVQHNSGGSTVVSITEAGYRRDTSAWFHLVWHWDTDNATASERVRIYVNGVRITSFSAQTYPPQGYDSAINYPYGGQAHTIGCYPGGSDIFDGYLSDVHFIDGQNVDPSAFGQNNADTGVWQPKAYSGPTDYGTNGYHYDFTDNSSVAGLWTDKSGKGNHASGVNTNLALDSVTDTPTNTYALLSDNDPAYSAGYLVNGGLEMTSTTSVLGTYFATVPLSNGKWYFEVTPTVYNALMIGVACGTHTNGWGRTNYVGGSAQSWGYSPGYGTKYYNGANWAYGATAGNGSVVGCYLDCDARTIGFTVNGVDQGIAFTDLVTWENGLVVGISDFAGSVTGAGRVNFGQTPFAHTPPEGYKAICTDNLPKPAIPDPRDYFWTEQYVGNGGVNVREWGYEFSPDIVSFMPATAGYARGWVDKARGASMTLWQDQTQGQTNNPDGLYSFNTVGFTVGSNANMNANGAVTTAKSWKAGALPGVNALIYQGDGVQGRAVAHGLGRQPDLVIIKQVSPGTTNWPVWHRWIGVNQKMYFNTTDVPATDATIWNNTAPDATNVYLGNSAEVNASGQMYVMYVFVSVGGFSQFGAYVSSGSTSGPFIRTGFQPELVVTKSMGGAYNWCSMDFSRRVGPASPICTFAEIMNTTVAPQSLSGSVDLHAQGFHLKTAFAGVNGSPANHFFMAFARRAGKYATSGP